MKGVSIVLIGLVIVLSSFGFHKSSQSQSSIDGLNQSIDTTFVEIGDLLSIYAERPPGLEFIKCEKGSGQVLAEATYRVSEANKSVEAFLIEHYGMARMKFRCCGWDSSKTGQYVSPKLEKIDPYAMLIITMYSEETLEQNREKVKTFFVVVEVAVV